MMENVNYWIVGVIYFLLSLVAAFAGQNRRIGFGKAFVNSLLFTPFIGIILCYLSPEVRQPIKE